MFDLHRVLLCTDVVIVGKVHILHKVLSIMQVLENIKLDWTVHDYGCFQGPMAVVKGKLYIKSHGLIYKQDRDSMHTAKTQRLSIRTPHKMLVIGVLGPTFFGFPILWIEPLGCFVLRCGCFDTGNSLFLILDMI